MINIVNYVKNRAIRYSIVQWYISIEVNNSSFTNITIHKNKKEYSINEKDLKNHLIHFFK